MLIEDTYIDLNSVIYMSNVVTKTGKHVIIVRIHDSPEPIWIENPNRISVSDLIQENLNASNFNKNNAIKPKRGRSSKRSSKKPDKDIAAAAAAADAKYAAARAAYALLTADNATESSADADSQANCSSASTSDGGNPF